MALPISGTWLVITPVSGNGLSLPPWSVRDIVETIEPIDQASSIRRACSGKMIDMTHAQFRKLQITITCVGLRAALMNKSWQGQVVTIDCLSERGYLTASGAPDRPAVSGSVRVGVLSEAGYTFYRPQLVIMITEIKHGKDDWKADYHWQLSGEELEVPTL